MANSQLFTVFNADILNVFIKKNPTILSLYSNAHTIL